MTLKVSSWCEGLTDDPDIEFEEPEPIHARVATPTLQPWVTAAIIQDYRFTIPDPKR